MRVVHGDRWAAVTSQRAFLAFNDSPEVPADASVGTVPRMSTRRHLLPTAFRVRPRQAVERIPRRVERTLRLTRACPKFWPTSAKLIAGRREAAPRSTPVGTGVQLAIAEAAKVADLARRNVIASGSPDGVSPTLIAGDDTRDRRPTGHDADRAAAWVCTVKRLRSGAIGNSHSTMRDSTRETGEAPRVRWRARHTSGDQPMTGSAASAGFGSAASINQPTDSRLSQRAS